MARRTVENSSRFTKFNGDCSVENSGNWCYVVGELLCYLATAKKPKAAKRFGVIKISSYFVMLALSFIENSHAFLFNTSIEANRFVRLMESC